MYIFILVLLVGLAGCKEKPKPVAKKETAKTPHETQVDSILGTMGLVDKVGEMTLYSVNVLAQGGPDQITKPFALDPQKLDHVLNTLRVGSILNVPGYALSLSQWRETITAIQQVATEKKPTHIPVLYGIDAIHGANYTQGATLFPQQIGLASTWNPIHAQMTGEVAAYEARASYIPWSFAPVCDIGRDKRWPRFWETFGEDVYLSRQMITALTQGFQGDTIADPYHVAACMKHFLGYSIPRTGHDRTPSFIHPRQLLEYHLPPFQAAVDAGVASAMISSGELNGLPNHANADILKNLLRSRMGFEGVAVTDWEDVTYLYTRHRVASDYKEAIGMAVNAGVDLVMVEKDLSFPVLLRELVEEEVISMERVAKYCSAAFMSAKLTSLSITSPIIPKPIIAILEVKRIPLRHGQQPRKASFFSKMKNKRYR